MKSLAKMKIQIHCELENMIAKKKFLEIIEICLKFQSQYHGNILK